VITSGPHDSKYLVVLAPGDEGLALDPGPTSIADALAQANVAARRFDFPPCDSGESGERDAVLARRISEVAQTRSSSQRLILAGISRGARVSALIAQSLNATALIAFAYPFHSRNDPDPGLRPAQLGALNIPILLLQGTRDSHGNRQQVEGYRLPQHVQIHWLDDANHSLTPRARSGHTRESLLRSSATEVARFLHAL
jgi:predicted alpha/beta-hydrolase family hydrolase